MASDAGDFEKLRWQFRKLDDKVEAEWKNFDQKAHDILEVCYQKSLETDATSEAEDVPSCEFEFERIVLKAYFGKINMCYGSDNYVHTCWEIQRANVPEPPEPLDHVDVKAGRYNEHPTSGPIPAATTLVIDGLNVMQFRRKDGRIVFRLWSLANAVRGLVNRVDSSVKIYLAVPARYLGPLVEHPLIDFWEGPRGEDPMIKIRKYMRLHSNLTWAISENSGESYYDSYNKHELQQIVKLMMESPHDTYLVTNDAEFLAPVYRDDRVTYESIFPSHVLVYTRYAGFTILEDQGDGLFAITPNEVCLC